jgi:hypothetical protein
MDKASEDTKRFPRTGLRVRYVRDEDVVAKPPSPETQDQPKARLCVSESEGVEMGDRAGNRCLVLSGLAPGALKVPLCGGPYDCMEGATVAMDFFVDSAALLEKAVAGPTSAYAAEPTVGLLTICPGLAVTLATRLREPTEDGGQRVVVASLSLQLWSTSVEVTDVTPDLWHGLGVSVHNAVVTVCMDGASFEIYLAMCPLPTSGLAELLVGGNGFGGGVKNVSLYTDPLLDLAPALECSACYLRLREQELQLAEEEARRRQEWEVRIPVMHHAWLELQ